MAETILQASPLPQRLVVQLRQHFPLVDQRDLAPLALAARAGEFTVLLVDGETAVSAAQIAALPQLKLIAVFGVGYERVDVQAARAQGVRVTHTPGVLTDDVADLAIGLLLATARQISGAQRWRLVARRLSLDAKSEWRAPGYPGAGADRAGDCSAGSRLQYGRQLPLPPTICRF
ncbi:Glyoxylate/hydroxypyruvate reductase B [Serratia quinivorans]|nr:Glyoxylate/hydroxypyruvate reductase B [Serratia quinivorans]